MAWKWNVYLTESVGCLPMPDALHQAPQPWPQPLTELGQAQLLTSGVRTPRDEFTQLHIKE